MHLLSGCAVELEIGASLLRTEAAGRAGVLQLQQPDLAPADGREPTRRIIPGLSLGDAVSHCRCLAAKTLPLPCVPTAFVARTLPLPCVSPLPSRLGHCLCLVCPTCLRG